MGGGGGGVLNRDGDLGRLITKSDRQREGLLEGGGLNRAFTVILD